jgi:hypothetical protein
MNRSAIQYHNGGAGPRSSGSGNQPWGFDVLAQCRRRFRLQGGAL